MTKLDARYALYVGWVCGAARRNGVPLEPVVDDDGDYTNRLTVAIDETIAITVIVPPPPADWFLGE